MKNKKYVLSILLFIILFLGTYYYVLKDYSLNDFILALNTCKYEYILGAILLVCSYCFFASFYLKRILKHFGKEITWYQAIGYFFTEKYFSSITPSSVGGQPVEMVEMHRDKIPYRISSVVILLNTMLYKVALILLAIMLLPFFGNDLIFNNSFFYWLLIFGFVSNLLLVLLFVALVYSKKLVLKIAKVSFCFLEKIRLLKKRQEWEEKLNEALKEYQACAKFTKAHPFILLEQFLILFLQRLSMLSISYLIYLAFGLSGFSYLEVLTIQIAVTLASDFVPFPGGVGISESLILQVNQLLYGSMLATSAMILLRGISFYSLVLICGIFYMIFHFRGRKRVWNYDRSI